MRGFLCFSLVFVFLISIQKSKVDGAVEAGVDSEEGDAEMFYNKSYSQHQTALEQKIFRGYNSKIRPVKNGSVPTIVDVHWHIIHVSINQKEQTMTIHGHIYMRWFDEFLVWDPKDFNGIHYARVKKWQVWQPKIKVSNSASGLGSAFDFSTSAHVIIQMVEKDRAKVEMYPTFSIKVGCAFDFASYPYDANKCAVNLFSTSTMAEVQLRNLYSIPPTLSFGWEEQKMKRIISDFKIENVTCSSFYYSSGNVTTDSPVTGFDLGVTWSMLAVTVSFVRHSPLFLAAVVAPCLVTAAISIATFFIDSVTLSFYMTMFNFYIQLIFMHDLIRRLPLSLSYTPYCIQLISFLMYSNAVSATFHCLLLTFNYYNLTVPKQLHKIYIIKEYLPNSWKDAEEIKDEDKYNKWSEFMKVARPIGGLLMILIYIIMFAICLLR